MTKRLIVAAGLVWCASTVGACKMIEQLKKSGAAAAGSAAAAVQAPSGEVEKDSQLNDKLEGYIFCMNHETSSVFRSRDYYLRNVDEEKGVTGKESSIYVYEVSPETCLKNLEEAKTKQPSLPDIEAAAAAYKTALEAVTKLTKTAHAYYDQKDFKDDKYAKGMAMHKPLLEAYSAFEKANKPFDDKVTALNEEVGQRRLARLKNDPTAKLEYAIAKNVDDAKKLVHFAETESLEKLDGAGYQAALTAYDASFTELTSYADAHADEAGKVTMFSRFKSEAADYLKAAKELGRRKRDNKGFEKEHGSPENIEGHPAQVLAKYNDMINASNSLSFRR